MSIDKSRLLVQKALLINKILCLDNIANDNYTGGMSTRGYSPENSILRREAEAGREDGSLYRLLEALQALGNKLHSDGALRVLERRGDDPEVKELADLAVSLREKMLLLLQKPRSSPWLFYLE